MKNLRKYNRNDFIFPVRIKILSNKKENIKEEHFHAFSDNISEGGIKIILKKQIPVHAKLELRFDLIINGEINFIETNAEIIRIISMQKGDYEYGIIFDKIKESDWNKIKEFMKDYCKE